MKTNAKTLSRPAIGLWEGVALLIVGILLAFGSRAEGAVTVTGTSLAEIPSFSDPDVVGRFYGQIGYDSGGTNEATLYGASTVGIPLTWQLNGDGAFYQESVTMMGVTLGGSTMTVDVGLANGSPEIGPVGYVSDGSITTLFIWVTSEGVDPRNRNIMDSLTVSQGGVGSVSAGQLMANGNSSNGTTFDGVRFDIVGGSGDITVAWTQRFEKDGGPFFEATGSSQTLNILAVNSVPEPSITMLGLLATTLIFRRRR